MTLCAHEQAAGPLHRAEGWKFMDCDDSSEPWRAFEIATVCPRQKRTASTTAIGFHNITHTVAIRGTDIYCQVQAGVRSELLAAAAPLPRVPQYISSAGG
jgi:hypothetical protein